MEKAKRAIIQLMHAKEHYDIHLDYEKDEVTKQKIKEEIWRIR
jgi:hypothetical protein